MMETSRSKLACGDEGALAFEASLGGEGALGGIVGRR
jgi:hypothetical protein